MNPFSFADKVYILNLDSRPDRWENCLKNIEEYQIDNFERFPGTQVNVEGVSPKRNGQIGCAISFASMIDKSLENDYESVVFLEDDFEFVYGPEETKEKVDKCLVELPTDWDMFYLGANVMDEILPIPLQEYSDNLFKVNSAYALHVAALSKKGLNGIRDSFKHFSKHWHWMLTSAYENMDVFLAQTFQRQNKCFIPKELLALQTPDFSSIEGTFFDYQKQMLDRFEHFSQLPANLDQ